MTFEEINNNIRSGVPCQSFDEAAEALLILRAGDRTITHLIAVRLAESKRLWNDENKKGSWVQWAVDSFRIENANAIHHRQAVGEMILALRDESSRVFRLMFELEITKLEALIAVFNAKGGAIGIINFIKIYPNVKSMRRDELREKVNVYLGKEKIEKAEQLTLELTFDVLGDLIDDERLSAITRSECFDVDAAGILALNGATLIKNAMPVLECYADVLELEDIEEMRQELAAVTERVSAILRQKKSRILG